jgi:hypothetical protein
MSPIGTNWTWCDVRSEYAFVGKAEVWLKGRFAAVTLLRQKDARANAHTHHHKYYRYP